MYTVFYCFDWALLGMKKILVTGATGFIGQAVVKKLLALAFSVSAAVRSVSPALPNSLTQIEIGDLASLPEDNSFLQGIDVVIHIAARAHIMNETESEPLAEFRKINTTATLNLAVQAAEAGVKRFIFISSIKVNGESTTRSLAFTSESTLIPTDPYALSKFEAEHGLLSLTKNTRMEVVIIRPPLVYGPGVKANFLTMINWVDTGIPLPLGAIHNKRSLIALDNLVSFICHCINHPKAGNEVFLISDGEDISTTQLLKKVAKALHKKSRLLPVPVRLMRIVARLIGKQAIASRLFDSLQINSAKARELLDWQPVVTMDEQLRKITENFQ